MKKVAILGSTGTIGTLTLEVVKKHPDRLKVHSLVAYKNVDLLASQIHDFVPKQVVVLDMEQCPNLHPSYKTFICCGSHCLLDIAADPEVDILVVAMTGTVAVDAVLAALEAGKRVALATKEILVSYGEFVTRALEKSSGQLLPIDSEHNAIHQCLDGRDLTTVNRIILTASGGPFRNQDYQGAAPAQVLNHPTWNMGNRITVDSATLMNKGFEVIEAHHLFSLPPDRIQVLIHPQSIVHSLVEFCDGSILAQLAVPDMHLPIAYALFYPHRLPGVVKSLDLTEVKTLDFEKPDWDRFPCLALAYQVLDKGGTAPAVLQAADQEVVASFLAGNIQFEQIPELIKQALDSVPHIAEPSMSQIRDSEQAATNYIRKGV